MRSTTEQEHIARDDHAEQYRDWLVAQQDDDTLQVLESELGRKVRPGDFRQGGTDDAA
jgi:hypothetical protein